MFVAIIFLNVTAVNKQDTHENTCKMEKVASFKYLNHKQELWLLYFTSILQFGLHILSKCQSRHHQFNEYCLADSLTNNKSAFFSSPEKNTALTHTVYLNRSFPSIRNKKKFQTCSILFYTLTLQQTLQTLSCATHKMICNQKAVKNKHSTL